MAEKSFRCKSTDAYINEEGRIVEICDLIANGGSLTTFSQENNYIYSHIINWIQDDSDRKKLYEASLHARGEWVAQRLLAELGRISFIDARKIYKEDGSLKPVDEWPDDVAAAISGVEITEAKYDKDGEEVSPSVKKVKLFDKLKALEMLGRNLKMFTDKIDHSGTMKLEELVVGSLEKKDDMEKKDDGD